VTSIDVSQRPATPGELCTCGRQAIVVYLSDVFDPTGYCGIGDGGDQAGPCPFCGGSRHSEPAGEGRCPRYRLRLEPNLGSNPEVDEEVDTGDGENDANPACRFAEDHLDWRCNGCGTCIACDNCRCGWEGLL